jgi:hypothetical protein
MKLTPGRQLERYGGAKVGASSRAFRLALALTLAVLLSATLLVGCGDSGAVNSYADMANGLLAQLNQKKIELRNYWTQGLAQQGNMGQSLDSFRKTLAECQELLDTKDSPDAARTLDDTLGQAVDKSRTLADLMTQFSDYFTSLSPMAQTAADIVTQLQSLDKSQYVPSTVAALAYKAQQLQGSLRGLNTNPYFKPISDQFTQFVGLMAKNLADAQSSLGNSNYTPTDNNNENDNSQQSAPDSEEARQKKRQIEQISRYTDAIANAWEELNQQVTSELDQIREATGVNASITEVENYIGQGVAEIKKLKEQYK